MHTDPIAAIATASGEASVSIVRISGDGAFELADRLFRCRGPLPSRRPGHTIVHGHVIDGQGQALDECLLLLFRAPKSYTREDVIELHGHGGVVSARRILRRCLEVGARMAEPGEFTKRAFLNGRIDLVQAEAVLDLIQSRSERASAAAVDQLEGRLSHEFDSLYERILMETARLEATLDFPEDELPEAILPEIGERMQSIALDFGRLISGWEEGHLLRDGALVVIIGEPNVGKSTLLNALLETERAIVTDIPGTTRDSIEESLILEGIPMRLVDTAGLRETEDQVEQIGIDRARQLLGQADLHLVLFDMSKPFDPSLLEGLDPEHTIAVLNKRDLADQPWDFEPAHVKTCLTRREGLDDLKRVMVESISRQTDLTAAPHAVISERHRHLLERSLSEVKAAIELLSEGREDLVVLAASRCRDALESLGQATGKVYQEELLDRIFSSFCIGK